MNTIQDVVTHLESIAPGRYQEDYDNSGLLTGDSTWPVKGVIVSLDCTEEVVEEAIATGCNLVVSHHPIIFKGLKRLTGRNYVERTVIKAIKNDIAIHSIHTNLDNVFHGVNHRIATRIGLTDLKVLSSMKGALSKLTTFIPLTHVDKVMNALHEAGAGNVGNYIRCSFRSEGVGHFQPTGDASPHIGKVNEPEAVKEIRVEVIFPGIDEQRILKALKSVHPYEEVAFYISKLENNHQLLGAGMIGHLPTAEEPIEFLKRLKQVMNTSCIRYTAISRSKVKKVAVCGGSGSFLLGEAIRQGAEAFVSADFKYHDFFDADKRIIVADIGHYESEQFTRDFLVEVLREKFPTFAINFSKKVTNPISYL